MGASAIQEKSMAGFWDEFILLLGQIFQSHPFSIKDTRNGNTSQGEFLGLTRPEGNVSAQGRWVWMTRSSLSAGAQRGIALKAQAGLLQPCRALGARLALRAQPGEGEERWA